MRTGKIAAVLAIMALASTGCFEQQALRQENEDLKTELQNKSQKLDEYLKGNITLNDELSDILREVSLISGQTTLLRSEMEDGAAKLTQAQQIEEHIAVIKKKIRDLERKSSDLTNTRNTIKQLNAIIEEQVLEINALKQEIEQKDSQIQSQRDTIQIQDHTIMQQRDQLQKTIAHQAQLLFNAGQDMEEIADNMPEVTRKKNQLKIGAHQQTIYQCALSYYQAALATGYAGAEERIASLKQKINSSQE